MEVREVSEGPALILATPPLAMYRQCLVVVLQRLRDAALLEKEVCVVSEGLAFTSTIPHLAMYRQGMDVVLQRLGKTSRQLQQPTRLLNQPSLCSAAKPLHRKQL